jgi:hypothetical protein
MAFAACVSLQLARFNALRPRVGAHAAKQHVRTRRTLDRARPMADRTSFTRCSIHQSTGTWYGETLKG